MKVLYFFSVGFDAPTPSYHLMETMVADTLTAGIDVHMILGHTTGQNADIPESLLKFSNLTYDIVKRADVKKNHFVKRYLEGIQYAFECSKYIKKISDFDVMFVQSSPTALFNVLIAKFCGKNKPFVYNIQDMFPGSSIYSGVMPNKLLQNIFYALQKIAYSNSTVITVISEDMKKRVLEQGVPEEKILTIVNWYDDNSVHEVAWEDNRFVKKYNFSKDKFYVQYAGTMGYVFDYKMIIAVAEILKDYKDIEFQMIGQGSQKEAFIKETENKKLSNINFYPLEAQEMVSDVYSTCSICLIPLKKGIIGNSVPSKAGLLMACNRAIVNSVDAESDYFKMFNDNEIGISASNENPIEVANAILLLYNDKERRVKIANNGQIFGKQYYARRLNTVKYIELFKTMAEKGSD